MSTLEDTPASSGPQDLAAAFSAAVTAHKSGNLEAAEAGYRFILKQSPLAPEPNYLLGALLRETGRFEQALASLQRCCKSAPDHADALSMLGDIYAGLDQQEQSIAAFEKAATAAKTNTTFWLNHARALASARRFEEAEVSFEKSLTLDPHQWAAHNGVAQCMLETGRLETALAKSRFCVAEAPEEPTPRATLVKCLLEHRTLDDAETECLDAEQTWPLDSRFPILRGQIHQHAKDRERARDAYAKALDIDPDSLEALSRMANLLNEDGQWKDAEGYALRALELFPNSPNMLTLMGRIRQMRGDLDGASDWYHRAIKADPDYAEAYNNLGNVLSYMDKSEDADAAFIRAESLKPDTDGIRVNAVIAQMTTGRLSKGWKDYRRRFALGTKNAVERPWPYPIWQGESLAGKRVLLWTEQGIGDQILFGRFAPVFINEAESGVFECPSRLLRLFHRSFPDLEIVPEAEAPDVHALSGPVDYHASVIDMCCARTDTPSTAPNAPLLHPDRSKTDELRRKYRATLGDRPLVGIAWRSGGTHTSHFKSTDLCDWGPILKDQDCAFVNLQYGDLKSEIDETQSQFNVPILTDDSVDPLGELDPYAAQIAAMDLVITTSNAAAHLAGALNVPVWNMTPTGPGRIWYWFNTGSTTPWYPSMTLFRHSHVEGWARVLANVGERLRQSSHDLIKL